MSAKLRSLDIRVVTESGVVGRSIKLGPGLNIIQASNSKGKSTLLNSVTFALGLEGAFQPQHAPPLPRAMTEVVEQDGIEHRVTESYVEIELQNGAESIWRIRRYARSEKFDVHLIRVWERIGVDGTEAAPRDYFVRLEGAMQREAGFHYNLARFLGWSLPTVSTFDGAEKQLYMEYLWPFFFVEQKKGWSEILGNIPSRLGVRDGYKRAMEFILELDAGEHDRQRQALIEKRLALQSAWATQAASLKRAADVVGGQVQGIADSISVRFNEISIDLPRVVVPHDSGWVALNEARTQAATAVAELEKRPIPEVGDDHPRLEAALDARRRELDALEVSQRNVMRNLAEEEGQGRALQERLDFLRVDLERHKDLARLEKLGSDIGGNQFLDDCPTCHQELPHTMLGLSSEGHPVEVMSTQDNIAFLASQTDTIAKLRNRSSRIVAGLMAERDALAQRATRCRLAIREVKDSLESSNATPSMARVQEVVDARTQNVRLRQVDEAVSQISSTLNKIAAEWNDVQRQVAAMRGVSASDDDETKIAALEAVMREEFREYQVASVPPDSIVLSRTQLRPEYESYLLQVELSASDTARLIWAFLVGLAEISNRFEGNHLGILVFDEPRQHHAGKEGYQAFLRRAAQPSSGPVQTIIATSEAADRIRELTENIPHTFVEISGRTIAPL